MHRRKSSGRRNCASDIKREIEYISGIILNSKQMSSAECENSYLIVSKTKAEEDKKGEYIRKEYYARVIY